MTSKTWIWSLLAFFVAASAAAQVPRSVVTHVELGGDLKVTKVDPAEPTENQAITVFFTLTNTSPIPMTGSVTLTGRSASSTAASRTQIGTLAPRQSISRSLAGLAPPAGKAAEIGFAFWEDVPGKEIFQPMLQWSFPLSVAASYELRIDNVTVDNPRAPQNDTLNGEATALFGGQPLPNPDPSSPFDQPGTQVQKFGNRGAGSILPTRFRFGPFTEVPGIAPVVKFNFIFANEGYSGSSEEAGLKALNGLSAAGQAIATFEIPQGSAAFDKANDVHKGINGALFSSCDGVVAAAQIEMQSDVIDAVTRSTGVYSENRAFEGTSSPVVCGKTSNYHVRFTILRLSFK
jgi:hypothetical protein